MRSVVHRILRKLPAPVAIRIEQAKRSVYASSDFRRSRQLLAKYAPDGRVRAGPFQGMHYVSEAVGSAYLAKVFGNYEHELHATFRALVATPFDLVVDIGAAEGYYAVGLALKMPNLRVVTFDIDKRARHLQKQLAQVNGVADRLDVRGAGDPAEVERALAGATRPLVICDCEGAEDQVLRPAEAPTLRRATVLLELHDHLVPGVSARVRERFAPTHAIEQIDESGAIPAAFVDGLNDEERHYLREGRVVEQSWLLMKPHAAQ